MQQLSTTTHAPVISTTTASTPENLTWVEQSTWWSFHSFSPLHHDWNSK
jgi:hypothetical protein